jgi:hypothetical protein
VDIGIRELHLTLGVDTKMLGVKGEMKTMRDLNLTFILGLIHKMSMGYLGVLFLLPHNFIQIVGALSEL